MVITYHLPCLNLSEEWEPVLNQLGQCPVSRTRLPAVSGPIE